MQRHKQIGRGAGASAAAAIADRQYTMRTRTFCGDRPAIGRPDRAAIASLFGTACRAHQPDTVAASPGRPAIGLHHPSRLCARKGFAVGQDATARECGAERE